MACSPSYSTSAPRMQTNAEWLSPSISFLAGAPQTPVEISSWTIDGVAKGSKGQRISLTAANGKIAIKSTTSLGVALTASDMTQLGVGEVTIEIMRRDPAPVRPLVRLIQQNNHGVA